MPQDRSENTYTVIKNFFIHTKVKDIMSTSLILISEDARLSEAFEKFRDHHISHLPVVQGKKKLVGILSQKYLYKAQSPRKSVGQDLAFDPGILLDGDSFYARETLDSYILSSIMQSRPFTLEPEDSAAEAVVAMSQKNLGCIPIVDADNNLCGLLTDKEIVDFTARILLT